MNVKDLKAGLPINADKLDEELCLQSARAVAAAEYALNAEQAYLSEQIAFNEFLAKKDEEIRGRWSKPKPPTVAEMEAALNRDKDVIAYRHKMLKLEMNKKLLSILRDGWRNRKDLLVEKCRDIRNERDHLNSDFVKGNAAYTKHPDAFSM